MARIIQSGNVKCPCTYLVETGLWTLIYDALPPVEDRDELWIRRNSKALRLLLSLCKDELQELLADVPLQAIYQLPIVALI